MFSDSANGKGHRISIVQVKNTLISIFSIRYIPTISKMRVDNSECLAVIIIITVTKKRLKTSKMFFFIQGSVLWPAKSKSDVNFCQTEPETFDNPEKNIFRIIQGFTIKLTKTKLLRFYYLSILMYYWSNSNVLYYLLPQKGWGWLIFPNHSKALGGAIAPIASSVGQNEAPTRRWASPITACHKIRTLCLSGKHYL